MKNTFNLLTLLFLPCFLWAQSPSKFSYQAVIRNGNQLVVNRQVTVEVSIIEGSESGVTVYTETHKPTTNANGLITLEVGNGTTTDNFTLVKWSGNSHFLQTRVDVNGGTNYTVTGISQLLSVPYSIHATTAQELIGLADTLAKHKPNGSETKLNSSNTISILGSGTAENPYIAEVVKPKFYIGQDTLGGIVYYVYTGADNQQHGLIVSKTETSAPWDYQYNNWLGGATSTCDGAYNTNLLPKMQGYTTARSCVENLGQGWYVPSIDELVLLIRNRFHVNSSNATGLTKFRLEDNYISSTEATGTEAYICALNGYFSKGLKTTNYKVRGVKSF